MLKETWQANRKLPRVKDAQVFTAAALPSIARTSRVGGVLICITGDITARVVANVSNRDFQLLALHVKPETKEHYVIVPAYARPNCDEASFRSLLSLTKPYLRYSEPGIVLGDFNAKAHPLHKGKANRSGSLIQTYMHGRRVKIANNSAATCKTHAG